MLGLDLTYSRSVSKANKVHCCSACNDPIVKDEFYTTFTEHTGFSHKSRYKICGFCEPILRHECRIVTQEFAREIKYSNSAYTWNYVASIFGFESYDDFKAYLSDTFPKAFTKP